MTGQISDNQPNLQQWPKGDWEPKFTCADCGGHPALKPECRTCKGKGWVK